MACGLENFDEVRSTVRVLRQRLQILVSSGPVASAIGVEYLGQFLGEWSVVFSTLVFNDFARSFKEGRAIILLETAEQSLD
jgi:hypothetical protein